MNESSDDDSEYSGFVSSHDGSMSLLARIQATNENIETEVHPAIFKTNNQQINSAIPESSEITEYDASNFLKEALGDDINCDQNTFCDNDGKQVNFGILV